MGDNESLTVWCCDCGTLFLLVLWVCFRSDRAISPLQHDVLSSLLFHRKSTTSRRDARQNRIDLDHRSVGSMSNL